MTEGETYISVISKNLTNYDIESNMINKTKNIFRRIWKDYLFPEISFYNNENELPMYKDQVPKKYT